MGTGGVLAACSSGSKAAPAASSTSTITLAYIAPFTGALAGFASGDHFVIDTIRATPAYAKVFKIGGKTYQVNIIVTDSRSDPNRASQLARQLILRNNVDLLLTSSTPETVNPVAVVGQTEGVPCLATNDPWESWYSGLGGSPAQPTTKLQFCTLFFFGLKNLQECYTPMWNRISAANKDIACQYPDDADGNAFRTVFEKFILESGYKPVDGGPFHRRDHRLHRDAHQVEGPDSRSSAMRAPPISTSSGGRRISGLEAGLHGGQGAAVPGRHGPAGPWSTTSPPTRGGARTCPTSPHWTRDGAAARQGLPGADRPGVGPAIGSTYSLFEVARRRSARSATP
jgi:hypothetical protein